MTQIDKLTAKRDNARRLAALNLKEAASLAGRMAEFKAHKAAEWSALADDLDAQIAYEIAA